VDYDVYAEGEAMLGWFNGTFQLTAGAQFDGNQLLSDLAEEVRGRLTGARPEVAHFKMVLSPSEEGSDIAVVNLVGSDRETEFSHRLQDPLMCGELIVNLRAETDPEVLRVAVFESLQTVASRAGAQTEVLHAEHFRPSRPVPTYRMASGAV
jgi:hypothetical protein